MKKSYLVLLSLFLALGLGACTATTKVTLNDITFASFYLGSELDPTDSLRTPLSAAEGLLVETMIDKAHWVSVEPDKDTLEPIGVLLYDTKGLRYELYQAEEMIVIKVTDAKKSAVYFQIEGDGDALAHLRLRYLKKTIDYKQTLIDSTMIGANAQGSSSQTTFDLATSQAEALKEMMHFEDWDAIEVLPIYSTLETDLMIITSPLTNLMFRATADDVIVSCLITVNDKSELLFYRIPRTIYDEIAASLKDWSYDTDPLIRPDLNNVVFTEVKFQLDTLATLTIKSDFFPITEAESLKAKSSLKISEWNRFQLNPTLSLILMTLKDTQGYVYTIGYSDECIAVQITDPKDPLYVLNYATPIKIELLAFSFMPLWEAALPTQAMLNFVPTQLQINMSTGEEADYRDVTLSSSNAKSLDALLKVSTWVLDPEPGRYAFGWLPSYVLKDSKGNSFSIYNYEPSSLMAVVVRTPSTTADEWIWYITSNTVFDDLTTFINAHYPNP